jgi:hypothetical protein
MSRRVETPSTPSPIYGEPMSGPVPMGPTIDAMLYGTHAKTREVCPRILDLRSGKGMRKRRHRILGLRSGKGIEEKVYWA